MGLDTHGLASVRNLDEWTEWTGVDFRDRSHVTAGDKFCRDVGDLPMTRTRVCPISAGAKAKFAAAQQGQ